jgi:hypothetical protein
VHESVYHVSLLQVVTPRLARAFREQALQGLFRDLEVALVQVAIVVKHLATCKQKVVIEVFSLQYSE